MWPVLSCGWFAWQCLWLVYCVMDSVCGVSFGCFTRVIQV